MLLRLLFSIVVLVTAGHCLSYDECPNAHWKRFGNNCYMGVRISRSFEDSKRSCRALKAELASIHSREEMDFLQLSFPVRDKYWIGLTRSGSEYSWTDNTKVNYTKWGSGDPDELFRSNWAVIVWHGDWWDTDSTKAHFQLCKIVLKPQKNATTHGMYEVDDVVSGLIARVDINTHNISVTSNYIERLVEWFNSTRTDSSTALSLHAQSPKQESGGSKFMLFLALVVISLVTHCICYFVFKHTKIGDVISSAIAGRSAGNSNVQYNGFSDV